MRHAFVATEPQSHDLRILAVPSSAVAAWRALSDIIMKA
jgi:hypothetical protein